MTTSTRNALTLAPTASECDLVAHEMVKDARWSLIIAGGRLTVFVAEGKIIRPLSFKISQPEAALATAPRGELVKVSCQGAAPRTAASTLATIAGQWTLEGVAWNHEDTGARLAYLAFRTAV